MEPPGMLLALGLVAVATLGFYFIARYFGKQAGREESAQWAYEQGVRDGYAAGARYGNNPLNPPGSDSLTIPAGTPRPPVPHTRFGHTSIKAAPGPRDWEPR